MTNIIMLGPPCSGKGTHSKLISNQYNLTHISTGELFRTEIEKETPIGVIAKQLIDHGNYVPDSITSKILFHHIKANPSPAGYLLDGFPRTLPQAEMLTKFTEKHHLTIDIAFFLHAPEDELLQRMLIRSNVDNRADDTEDTFVTRLLNYYNNTHILTDYYKSQGKLISICTNNCIKEVSSEIFSYIDHLNQEKK
jgi:adenylate kinase